MSRKHIHPIPWTCWIFGHAMANASSRNVQFAEDFCLRDGCPGAGHAWSEFEHEPGRSAAEYIRHCTIDGCSETWRLKVPDMLGVNPTIHITEKALDDFEYSVEDLEPRRADRLGKRGTWVAPRTGGYTPTENREPGQPPCGPAAAHNVPTLESELRAFADRGEPGAPDTRLLQAVADALGVDVGDLARWIPTAYKGRR